MPDGLLVIGHSESLFSITDQFESLGDTIYKIKSSAATGRRSPPSAPAAKPQPTVVSSPPKPAAKPRLERKPIERVTNSTSDAGHFVRVPGSNKSPEDRADQVVLPSKVLVVGEYMASREETLLQTVLGSCVAACLIDPSNRLGGMNHFMLPESLDGDKVCATYGVHAMELLINAIMKLGGNRQKLVAKIFGGARVVENLSHSWDVGKRNVEFVKKFLDTERIPIVAEHVLGNCGRRVKLIPTSGKVFVNLLDRVASISAENEERAGGKQAFERTRSAVHSPLRYSIKVAK